MNTVPKIIILLFIVAHSIPMKPMQQSSQPTTIKTGKTAVHHSNKARLSKDVTMSSDALTLLRYFNLLNLGKIDFSNLPNGIREQIALLRFGVNQITTQNAIVFDADQIVRDQAVMEAFIAHVLDANIMYSKKADKFFINFVIKLFYHAARTGQLDTLRYLFEHFEIETWGLNAFGYALHIAAENNQQHIMTWLLDQGVTIDVPDDTHETALFGAIRNNNYDATLWLLERGANPNQRNRRNQTALEIVRLLPDAQNLFGMIRALLNHGAYPRYETFRILYNAGLEDRERRYLQSLFEDARLGQTIYQLHLPLEVLGEVTRQLAPERNHRDGLYSIISLLPI